MKRKTATKGFAIAAFGIFLGFCLLSPVQAQEFNWKLQSLLNPGHMAPDAEAWMAKQVEALTGGKFKIQMFYGRGLGFPGQQMLSIVGSGAIQAAELWGPHVSGECRILEIMCSHGLVPFDVPLRQRISKAIFPYQKKILMEKFNIIPLYMAQVDPRCIYTKKPVKRFSDLKGMKIRCEGIVEKEITRMMGATPLVVAWSEVYPSLQQGVIDGYWVTHSATYDAKLYEHASYCLELLMGGSTTFTLVNLDKFKALPEEYQKILLEAGDRAGEFINNRVMGDVPRYKKKLEEKGFTFYAPHPDDLAMVKEKAPAVWKQWAAKAEKPEVDHMLNIMKAYVAAWDKIK